VEKIRIEGIKLSGELALVNVASHPRPQFALFRLCKILASNRINIPFISAMCRSGRSRSSCCVDMEDFGRARAFIGEDPDLAGHIEFIPAVGLLSVFPHRFRLQILGLSLHALGKAGLSVHGLTSSLAPLTFVLDYAVLDAAAAALEGIFHMPPNQRPIRNHFHVTQSPLRHGEEPPESL